ncbi:MAG: DUF4082 domain-containing protein [Longimicrobiaceae bacterium]
MTRHCRMIAAALFLAACADTPTAAREGARPPGARATLTQTVWTIFTTQTPASTLDATGGWEVGTRFYTDTPGCVVGVRFWRAVGETGSHRVNLWTNSGTRLGTIVFTPTGSGWKEAYFGGPVCLDTLTYYRVSVNTNTKQVKTFGAFDSGPIVNGPLTGNLGYYGQPTGSMPTTSTGSNFFVDPIFDTSISY